MKSNLKGAATTGIFWMFSATLGQNLLQLISVIILARLLAPEDFGVVASAMIIIELLRIFAELGVGPAVVQLKALDAQVVRTANTLALSLGILMGTVVYLSATSLAAFFEMQDLEAVVKVLALMLPITGLTVVGNAFLQRQLQFKRIGFYTFFSYFVSHGLIAVLLALNNFGLWSLVFAALARAFTMLFLIRLTMKGERGYGFSVSTIKMLLGYGAGQSLGQLANYFANQGDNIIVGKMLGAESLGFYSRAYQLMLLPAGLIGTVIDKVLFPIMSGIQDENARLVKAYLLLLSLINMLVFPLSALLIILAYEIVSILLGEQWVSIVPVFQILVTVLVFRVSYKVSDSLSRAKGSVYRRAWRQAAYAGMVFMGAFTGHYWGLVGVAMGVALAVFGNFLLMIVLSQSLIKFDWRPVFWAHAKHFLVALWAGGCLFLAKSILVSLGVGQLPLIFVCVCVCGLAVITGWLLMRKLLKAELGFMMYLLGRLR